MLFRLKMAVSLAVVVIFSSCHSPQTTSDRYQSGQVWAYKTRVGEERSRLTIEHILRRQDGEEIIFVAVDNLHITNSSHRQEWTSFSSFPFTRESLDSSVTELLRTDGLALKVNGDALGPTPTEWLKEKGEPVRVPVAHSVTTLAAAKWPQAQHDTPLKAPLGNLPPTH
jgi:hypothetical protein